MELTREQVLTDTINYYSEDVKRRCVCEKGVCYYSGTSIGKDTEGCAVGRLVSPELRTELDKKGGPVPYVFDMLPPDIQSLGLEFIRQLQIFHDRDYNWNEHGLTESGKGAVNSIITKFNLNLTKL